ncbi:HNH endonuclease [Bacillus cereus]|uniref:HNH endonuclease n=1 Tax=Bacillus cereus group TaxID=86661 RepID=UPI000A3018B7|nr:HNH endonuclease [Bacillus cereus]MCU5253442.1 HNH endonuclease [Bacillus cereus]MEC2500840.1 HNH endonuclease [Bacillus cereus]SMD73711.1 hypothetical protein BACERE00188_00328 [Bacillus cereus]HDR4584679.1 HNH endonuclease [Bacillus cereus]
MPHNKRFAVDEIEFIKDNYSLISVDELAEHLDRTPKAVRGKIERLGLKLSKLPRNEPYSWSEEDLQVLKNNHTLPDYKINELLPKFSLAQITRKRLELGLRKHTYEPYIKSDYYQTFRDGKRVWIHKEVAEQKIGRKLLDGEVVHHVNGNKLDNDPTNLFVCSDKRHHGLIHGNLEQVAFELVKQGVITFNHSTGEYYLE